MANMMIDNVLEKALFKSSKEHRVNSSTLCCHSILISALARGIDIKVHSATDIQMLCDAQSVAYKKHYHGVGQVFSLCGEGKEVVLNKTKLLNGCLPSVFSKKALKSPEQLALSSPKGVVFRKSALSRYLIESNAIQYPVVLKPVSGSMGKGVHLDINSFEELYKLVNESTGGELVVEEQVQGDEYRIYLIKGRYYGAAKRVCAHVIGDGKSSIGRLIDEKNRLKKKSHLPAIDVEKALDYIAGKGVKENYVLPRGEYLPLSSILGRSSGGDVSDVSESLPKWVKQKVNDLGDYFSDNLCIGLDVIVNKNNFYIIEANDRPQLSSLLTPDEGEGRNIADALVEAIFPGTKLKYKVGGGIANIRKIVNSVKAHNQSLSIESRLFDFEKLSNSANDKQYKSLKLPVNSNRLLSRREAFSRGMAVSTWVTERGSLRWSITSPQRSIVFRENMPSSTSQSTRSLTNDKERTKRRLLKNAISVPSGIRIHSENADAALTWFDSLGASPLAVVKPFNGSGGKGVISAINTKEALLRALSSLLEEEAIVEEHVHGFDYRLLVVDGKFKFAIKRDPAHVVGDGVSTVKVLVEQKNKIRINNPYNGKYPLQLNDAVLQRIKGRGFSKSSVLRFGEKLYLQDIANIGAGGDSEDVTSQVHPDFIEIAERAYTSFTDMAFCGLDLITQDISQPAAGQRYAVIEVNANCDFAIHHFPTCGEPRDAAGAILDALFPESSRVSTVTRELCITGKVQGVGYRKWFTRQAIQRAIDGTVSNFEDGSVRAVVQGTLSAIDDLVRNASKGPARAVVKQIAIAEHLDADTYDGFIVV